MIYRDLGRTGLKVSQLGFGAMRLPMQGEGPQARVDRALALPMFQRAFAAGVNYIDTAVGYCNQDSQRAVGDALQACRDRIVVSTKNPCYSADEREWWTNLENSLERLRVTSIDLYNHHGLNWKLYTEAVAPRLSRWMQRAKDQGLIQHIGCSFHDNNEGLRRIVDTGYVEVITLQYNLLDRQLEDGIAYARSQGVGVVVMGPVGGGRFGVPNPVLAALVPGVQAVPELALRFVLSRPAVTVALSGMSTLAHVEENLKVAADPVSLTAAQQQQIDEHLVRLRKMADLYCTGCRYCLPCESGVDIPAVFDLYNRGRVYGFWAAARAAYRGLVQNKKDAEICRDCGACEEKCPQHLPIRRQLQEARAALQPAP